MDQKISSDINTFGWTVLLVEETDYLPSFAFTLGLWKTWGHPELICFGLPVNTLQQVLNTAGELIKNGAQLQTDKSYDDFFEQSEVRVLQVDKENLGDYFGYALDYYKTESLPALQLVWQDRKQLFPWEEGFEQEFRYRQPLLDRNMDFRFSEPEDLAVFTTRQFLDNQLAPDHVAHDTEGSWHFLTPGFADEDIRVVSLKQVIDKDLSLNRLFNLDLGEQAIRKDPAAAWERSLINSSNS